MNIFKFGANLGMYRVEHRFRVEWHHGHVSTDLIQREIT